MDKLQKKLWQLIQTDFPLTSRPYQELGTRCGYSEGEVIRQIRRWKKEGIIREIKPSFDTRGIGYVSTLIGMQVPKQRLKEVVHFINQYPEVTHNYGREDKYNLWFTLIAKDRKRIREILQEIKRKTGIKEVRDFPAEKIFKIKVVFK